MLFSRLRSWSQDRSRPEFHSIGLGTRGLGLEGSVSAVFETD